MTAAPKLANEPKIAVLRRLQQTITEKNLDAVLAFFAPDVEYHYHVGTRPLVGREWVGKFFQKYWANNTNSTWVIDHHAEVDGRLFTEGREEYVNASGQTVAHPYMGIIEFRDGLIVAWRDYFQMADPNAGK